MNDSTPSPRTGPAVRRPIHRTNYIKKIITNTTNITNVQQINITTTNPSDIDATEGKKVKAKFLQLPPSDVSPKWPNDNFSSDSSIDSSQNATLTDDENNSGNDSRDDRRSAVREIVPPKLESPSPPRPKPDPDHRGQPNSTFFVYLAVALAIIAAAIGLWWMQTQATPAKRTSCEDFLQLHSKYPNMDDELWVTLIVSVNRTINKDPGEPGTFIFLYNSSSVGQSLLDDVTRITLQCFGSGGAIWRTSKDFETAQTEQDYGTALDLYRKELRAQKVLVVQELDRVPPTAAKVFFTICDTYEPLVHRAIIFFTIDVSGQPRQENRSATAVAEGILKGLWRDELHPNVLDPLVVRLTENVFRID